jgi:oxygen-independent coproporphyrinogen-3 oxidase
MPTRPPLAIYIHWPFCRSKCPYCDFNSHVRERIDRGAWTAALLADLDRQRELALEHEVVSIFFGGGTPSLMPPDTAAALIERVRRHWPARHDIEITLEANPNSAEAERFAGFAAAGINRLSLGVQALDAKALKFLGRAHNRKEALTAIKLSRQLFSRTSFDLIYARPGQSPAAWCDELDETLALAGEHLSLYQLTIEPGTAFGNRAARGEALAADEEIGAALFEITQQRLDKAGLPAYEISNHARPGSESRHNLIYWRGHDYAGIGAGAHSRITADGAKRARSTIKSPEGWLTQVEASNHGIMSEETLSPEDAAEEYLLMGLRLAEGLDLARLAAIGGSALDEGRLDALESDGLITRSGLRLAATHEGRLVLNRLILELAA